MGDSGSKESSPGSADHSGHGPAGSAARPNGVPPSSSGVGAEDGAAGEPLQELLASLVRESAALDAGFSVEDVEDLQETGFGIAPGRGPAHLGADELPSPMIERLTRRPSDSLQSMLTTVRQEGEGIRPGFSIRDVGTVRKVGDGVASVSGLPQATVDELLEFPGGIMGLVMNLEADWTDCILLGSDEGIQGGDLVWSTGERITIPVGELLLGRVVTPLGRPIDGKGPIHADERRFVEREAPGVVQRQAVGEPLHSGIKCIDAIVPIGRGQRELIVGDRQTGKTSIALDTIINQREQGVLCVYVAIGQRKSAVLQAVRVLEEARALGHTVVVVAPPDDPPALVYLAPYAGCTVAEAFLDHGRDVLIVYDDLTKHADAYRELSLLLRRPPGREAYPGDIFYLHARLLERACRLRDEDGGGSITALPIVETRRSNITAYIPTNLISITDGQIYLSPDLFNQNIRPAIDVGLSVSRVGGAAQTPIMHKISGQLKLTLAQYEEVAHFARFGAEIDRTTRQQITRGMHLREVLKQPAYSPQSLSQQILILHAAGEGYLDDLPLEVLARYERELWLHAQRENRPLVRRIEEQGDLGDLPQSIDTLVRTFTSSFM